MKGPLVLAAMGMVWPRRSWWIAGVACLACFGLGILVGERIGSVREIASTPQAATPTVERPLEISRGRPEGPAGVAPEKEVVPSPPETSGDEEVVAVAVADSKLKAEKADSEDEDEFEAAPQDQLIVLVLDPARKPISKVQFKVGIKGTRDETKTRGIRQENGSFRVHPDYGDDEAEEGSRYFLLVKPEGYGQREVEFTRGTTREITVEFSTPARLVGKVEGLSNATLSEQLQLRLVGTEWGAFLFQEIIDLEPNGEAHFEPLDPGIYDLCLEQRWVRDQGPSALGFLSWVQRLTIAAGDNAATFQLPKFHDLTVEFPEGTSKWDAGLRRLPPKAEDGPMILWDTHRIGKDRKAVFHWVPEGSYRVTLEGSGEKQEMAVQVPAPEPVNFLGKPVIEGEGPANPLEVFNCFRVTSLGLEELKPYGLLAGDLIVEIDGKELSGTKDKLRARLLGACLSKALDHANDQVLMTILRAGENFKVSIPPKEVTRKLLGSLEPATK